MRQSLWPFAFVLAHAVTGAAQQDPTKVKPPVPVPEAAKPAAPAWDVDKAIKYLHDNAKDESQSACARFTRLAVNAGGGGVNVPGLGQELGRAKNYGKPLVDNGFKDCGQLDSKQWKKGDVVIFEATEAHKDGHMAMFDGKKWVSDFKQVNFNVWSDVKNPTYKIYRHESQQVAPSATRNGLGGVLVNPAPVTVGPLPPGEAEKLLPKATGPDGKPPVKWTVPLPKVDPPPEDEAIAVSLRQVKAFLDGKEAQELFGGTQLLGFILTDDELGKDCVLLLKQEKGRPPLRLDHLAVAYRAAKKGAAPACTIDPRAEVLKRLKEKSDEFNPKAPPDAVEKHFAEWRTIAVSPQDVRVFGVPADTHLAKVMVDADYLLKSVCDGTEAIDGVTGFADRAVAEAKERRAKGGGDAPLDVASRFWFNAGAVECKYGNGLFVLSKCEVLLLTEQEAVTPDGKRSGTGKGNPLAKAFADEFGAKYAAASAAKPVYRELENVYRAVALVSLMGDEAKGGAAAVIDGTLGAVKPAVFKPAETVPGRATVKKVEGTNPGGGNYVLWLPSCGGVSIDIKAADVKRDKAKDAELSKFAQAIQANRPNARAATWKVTVPRPSP